MSSYGFDDKKFKSFHYKTKLEIFKPIAFFTNNEDAKNYILNFGKKLTDTFEEVYDQGCAFCIITQLMKINVLLFLVNSLITYI